MAIGGVNVKKAEADNIAKRLLGECAQKTLEIMDKLKQNGWTPKGLDDPDPPEIKALDDECRQKLKELVAQIEE